MAPSALLTVNIGIDWKTPVSLVAKGGAVRAFAASVVTATLLFFFAACGGGGSPELTPAPDAANALVLADFNNDGAVDIALATSHNGLTTPLPGFVSVKLQDRVVPGAFLSSTQYGTDPNPAALSTGDLNGDGLRDLVAFSRSGNVTILVGDPANPGTFRTPITLAAGGAANSPHAVAIGDLNGDGRLDIAVATGTSVAIFFQDPANAGQYLQPPLRLNVAATAIAIGDLNGDGMSDFVVIASNVVSSTASVFFQSASTPGTFPIRSDLPAGTSPFSVALGDLNGDGLVDIAVADWGSGNQLTDSGTTILLQDAAHHGSFLAPVFYQLPGGAIDVALADLNGDLRLDLVVGIQGGNALGAPAGISTLLQDPIHPGVFNSPTSAPTPAFVSAVAVADLNGDGKPDIALLALGNLLVLFQSGSGTFH